MSRTQKESQKSNHIRDDESGRKRVLKMLAFLSSHKNHRTTQIQSIATRFCFFMSAKRSTRRHCHNCLTYILFSFSDSILRFTNIIAPNITSYGKHKVKQVFTKGQRVILEFQIHYYLRECRRLTATKFTSLLQIGRVLAAAQYTWHEY